MSKITTEKYDLVRIERIRNFLESSTEKGKPKFYEIFVDNLKAVDKTDDIGCFDEYKMYMDENSQMVKILIYTSTENCPRNDKFIFSVRNPQEEKRQEQLNGIDFQNKIDLAIQQERDRTQLLQLQKELEATKAQLEEAEEYGESLQEKLVELQLSFKQFKEKRIGLSEMNTGRLVGFVTNYFIKSYPSLAKKVPVLSTLSGFLTDDAESAEQLGDVPQTSSEGSVSFSKKNADLNSAPEFDGETKQKLAFIEEMEDAFSTDQLQQVCEIIKGLQAHPDQIGILHSLFYPSKSK